MENFKPSRNCTNNEHECKNSYGHKICVEEKFKQVACAEYWTILCNEDKFLYEYFNGELRKGLGLHVFMNYFLIRFYSLSARK